MKNKNTNRVRLSMIVSFLLIFMIACTPESPPLSPNDLTPTVTVTETPTPTMEPSVSATPTPTEEVTPVVTDEPTPMVTDELTPTPTEEVTPSVTEEPTPTVTATPTPEPTATPIPTNTPVPTNTPTPTTKPATPTPVPTKEPTKAPTNTPVPTKAPTSTPKPTNTPTPKPTQKPTNTPTPVPTKAPEQPTTVWIARNNTDLYDINSGVVMTVVGTIAKGTQVTRVRTNVTDASNKVDWLDEITYNGNHYLLWDSDLSTTKVEGKWSEPRERKDMSQLLMNKVNAYRESKGIRKFEDPFVYDDTSNPGMGPYLYNNALRVAKRCCLEHTANHEGGQIGAGWYSTGQKTPRSAEEVANELFNNWKNSPGHNGNMLQQIDMVHDVDVALMVVVEYYDGSNYQYCAIMGMSAVNKQNLPEGLQ